MSFWTILFAMLGMILGSLVLERVLPMSVKDRLGVAICWSMMFITMTFLTLATLALGYILGIQPFLTS